MREVRRLRNRVTHAEKEAQAAKDALTAAPTIEGLDSAEDVLREGATEAEERNGPVGRVPHAAEGGGRRVLRALVRPDGAGQRLDVGEADDNESFDGMRRREVGAAHAGGGGGGAGVSSWYRHGWGRGVEGGARESGHLVILR